MKKLIKEISDYLHYYPKVFVLICEPGIEPVSAYLEGYDWYSNLAICERTNYDPTWIKPILRRLEDITEEEILKVCKLASPEAFGDFRFAKWEVNKDPKWGKDWKAYLVTNKNAEYEFVVDVIDGDITIYHKDGDYEPTIINNNYRFWYLKNFFDIFGLIDDNLALDMSKVPFEQHKIQEIIKKEYEHLCSLTPKERRAYFMQLKTTDKTKWDLLANDKQSIEILDRTS